MRKPSKQVSRDPRQVSVGELKTVHGGLITEIGFPAVANNTMQTDVNPQ